MAECRQAKQHLWPPFATHQPALQPAAGHIPNTEALHAPLPSNAARRRVPTLRALGPRILNTYAARQPGLCSRQRGTQALGMGGHRQLTFKHHTLQNCTCHRGGDPPHGHQRSSRRTASCNQSLSSGGLWAGRGHTVARPAQQAPFRRKLEPDRQQAGCWAGAHCGSASRGSAQGTQESSRDTTATGRARTWQR